MAKLNLSENLFIGAQELNTLQNFQIDIKGLMGLMASNFGFIENKDAIRLSKITKEERNSFKLSSPGSYKLQFSTPSYAFAYPDKVISWKDDRIINLSDAYKDKIYWVKISYQEEFIENGTLTIDTKGNILGVGTKFTDKLRGEPNFPSKITLFTYSGNSFDERGEYYVEDVRSDTSIKVISPTGTIGNTNLTYYYAVNGTFPVGSNVYSDDKFPFIYDGCRVEFVEETTDGEIPNSFIMKESNTEFYVARIKISAQGTIHIEDKRFIFESDEDDRYSKWFKMK